MYSFHLLLLKTDPNSWRRYDWVKEHRLKEKRVDLKPIYDADGVEDDPIIFGRRNVPHADSGNLLRLDRTHGRIRKLTKSA